jgi:uncharacterized protein (TIGR00725 family)
MRRHIVTVVGAGRSATEADTKMARILGGLIAQHGWVLLSGGTALGIMDAVNQGASEAGGLTIGIIAQADDSKMSKYVDLPIFTGMLSGRNIINALSGEVMIACGVAPGTLSEIALALRADKDVVFISKESDDKAFIKKVGGEKVHLVDGPEEAVSLVEKLLETEQ